MTDSTTQLTRLRARMLATAYSNADIWTRRSAFLTDQAVAALARCDRAAAETLAAQLLAPEFLSDPQILGAAIEAGIDTNGWEERREKTRTYTREAHELAPRFDPETEATRIWSSLYDHYPQIAAALAAFLSEMPPTWREDLFTNSSPYSPAVHRQVSERPGPETAPYDALGWEDCPACAEAQDQCRYHAGFFAGMEYQRDLIQTALTDHTAIDHLQQRHTELEGSAGQAAAADVSTPLHEQEAAR
ncbi:hypothetical protein QF035_000022 [Streptomyces umbrinus]|uniref:Uncharacterized protein n=1 Tax=Streptomyces umbrinus TaxID=67370 RepID=A0ABU0SFV7_9ACTN|nr:hypothetical protein [Streptomyces umbrinus]MDQ1022440.1 hypothetical protein [Streptomyces umbrinus]